MKKIIVIALGSLILSCEKKIEKVEREDKPDVLLVEDTDKQMNDAIRNATETIPEFNTALKSKNPNFSNFSIKQRFETADGGGEHIWIGDIESRNNQFYGIVQNDPLDVPNVKMGDSVWVVTENISDWMYYDKNIVKGAFTVKVFRKNMSAEDRNHP